MPKKALKEAIRQQNGNHCALSDQPLPDDVALYDTHRPVPKRKGGKYSVKETLIADPVAHMKEHGTYRERQEAFEALKTLMDDRRQMLKLKLKINNQMLAYKRKTDKFNPETLEFLKTQLKPVSDKLDIIEKAVKKALKTIDHPIVAAATKVRSVGEMTLAACLVYINLEKADHASSLWKYVGLDCPNHERYEKGKAGGGNKTLRTALYTMAVSQEKSKDGRGAYRNIYDQVKGRLEKSERIIKSRNTEGHLIECAWKDAMPCHRQGAALRAVMKHFLADYWFVGRTLAGLPTTSIYAEAVLGQGHRTIDPRFRGWKF